MQDSDTHMSSVDIDVNPTARACSFPSAIIAWYSVKKWQDNMIK